MIVSMFLASFLTFVSSMIFFAMVNATLSISITMTKAIISSIRLMPFWGFWLFFIFFV